MATIEDRAIAAFNTINGREYKCALAESQVSENLYEQVKKEYSVAQNAFLQGVMYQRKIDIDKAVEWLRQCTTFIHPDYRHPVPYFSEDELYEFRKAMEE